MAMNQGSETGQFLLLMATLEHDDPEQAPEYLGEKLRRVGDMYLTEETVQELSRSAA